MVCKYGHVGRRNEVSVNRFIATPRNYSIIDVLDIVRTMPGIKNSSILSGVLKVESITEKQYKIGKTLEDQNFYLMNLKPFNALK